MLSKNVVAGHLRSLIPGQCSPGEIRQPGEDVAECVDERLGAVSVWEMYQAIALLVLSTRVPIAERLCFPTIKSPSQSPILVRASTIGGR